MLPQAANITLLKAKNQMTFNIIQHAGTPQKALLPDGKTYVYRQEKLFIMEFRAFVVCAPYDDHFIYEMPPHIIGSTYMCTCGSAAVVAPPDPQGLLVCMFHVDHGYHTTSVVNKKDVPGLSGELVDPSKGRTWQ